MLDLIYIVEDSHSPSAKSENRPDGRSVTPPGRDQSLNNSSGVSEVALLGAVAVASPLLSLLPTSLIVSAVSGAPSLARLLMSEKDEIPADANPSLEEGQAKTLVSFVNKHAMSPDEAKARGYLFQPGHPIVGKAYKKHPLADYANAKKSNLYIPSDSYDAILLEERESELLRLLVYLGAIHISITKKTSDLTRSALRANVSVDIALKAAAGLGYASNSENCFDVFDTREFSLSGKPWTQGSTVSEGQFFWLAYEPSWAAVVFAREHGGCLSASLEIKETTSFSTDKNIELSVKAKMLNAGLGGGLSDLDSTEKTYYIKADFAPVIAAQ